MNSPLLALWLLIPLDAGMAPRLESVHAVPEAALVAVTPRVAGTVADTAGNALSDVHVIIPSVNRSTTTDATGRFTFTGLPAGSYHIVTTLTGYTTGHGDVVVPETGDEVQVSIVMRRARAITQLTPVQVTATPVGTDPRDVAQSTTEISGRALNRSLSTSVAQTLANEPGISVRNNGPAASAPVIRGLSGERVLVLHDGERAADLSSTSPDHAVSIDPLTAQRIEVVRGPASLLYGNNALGGVVNVISNDLPTTIPTHVHGYVNAQGESATPGGGAAVGVVAPLSERVAAIFRAEARSSDDLRMGGGAKLPNSYHRNNSGTAGLGFASATTSGGLVYRRHAFDYGLPGLEGEGPHIEGGRHELNGRIETGSVGRLFTSARVSSTAQWYEHDEVEENGEVGTNFKLRTNTFDALGRTRVGTVLGALGISGLLRDYEPTGEEALTPPASMRSFGAFIYEEIPLRPAPDEMRVPRVQLGGRYDTYRVESEAGDERFGPGASRRFNNFSGSIGISVPLTQGLTVAASVARAFRAPTVEELFSHGFHAAAGTYDIGNSNLTSETNNGIEALLRGQAARFNAQASVYYNRVRNFITPDIVRDTLVESEEGPGTVPLNRYRQADATLRGAEGRVEVETGRNLVLGAMADWVRGTFTGGEPLPFIPSARVGALARFDNGRFSADADYRHAFAQDRVPPPTSGNDPAAVATDAYDLLNLSTSYNFVVGSLTHAVTFRVDNVLDERYRDATSRIKNFAFGPGRNFVLAYRLLF